MLAARIGADDFVVLAPEAREQGAVAVEPVGPGAGEPVVGHDVHTQELSVGPLADPCGATDQRITGRCAGEAHHDTLARLPLRVDPMAFAVLAERVVDAIGDPEERQLAERGEVARSEVVGQRRVDLLGAVDVAVGHPTPEGFRRHVDELDLLGSADDRIGDDLLLADPGDALHHVVDRLEVLHVEGGDDVDAGLEELLHVLPSFGVA